MKHTILWLSLVFSVISCQNSAGMIPIVTPNNETIYLELADTPSKRTQGLMFRTDLAYNHGMLFVFSDTQVRTFWMKNTSIPLSIAYIDLQGQVVHIADMHPHTLDLVSSIVPVPYAIEMNQGVLEQFGIRKGTILNIPAALYTNAE